MTPNKENENVSYLGDGVYIRDDGDSICLMANSHLNPTDTIYLEDEQAEALLEWVKRWKKDSTND